MDEANLVLSAQNMGTEPHSREIGIEAAPCGRIAPTGLKKLRVDGKFFALADRRVRIRGGTYGPFTPGNSGEPVPPPGRVGGHRAGLRAGRIHTVRTYHLPPGWLLRRADRPGVGGV